MSIIVVRGVTVPSILAAILLVSGIFAFIPIDNAATVHTTIQNTVIRVATFNDANWEATGEDATQDEKRLTCTAPANINEVSFDVENLGGAGDNINLVIDPDGPGTAAFDAVTQADIFGGGGAADEPTLLATRGLNQGVSLTTNGALSLTLTAEDADGNNEVVDLIAYYTSQGTCSWGDA